MKSFLNQKRTRLIIAIFAAMFALGVNAATMKIGKYQIGVISEPFAGAAAWKNDLKEWQCRFANSSELLSILAAIENKNESEAILYTEALTSTRDLTPSEIIYCKGLISIIEKANSLTVSPNGKYLTRPTYDITATTKTGKTVNVGAPCEGNIIKYRYSTKSYYKITGRNETALCGVY